MLAMWCLHALMHSSAINVAFASAHAIAIIHERDLLKYKTISYSQSIKMSIHYTALKEIENPFLGKLYASITGVA